MDSGRIIVMEEKREGTGLKTAEKFIQIDSICIDLCSSDDKCDGQECEPFSIRGYVSNMRKKDSKICWPFSDIHHDHGHILSVPPVYDPSFNLQRGKSHCQKSSDKVSDGFIFDSCHSLGTFSSASPKATKQDVRNGRTMIETASNLGRQPLSSDEMEKELGVGLISQSEPGIASDEVTKIIAPVSENLILEDGKQTAADHLNGRLTVVVSQNDGTIDVDRAHDHAVEFQKNANVSMESNESTIPSFESAETVGNNPRHYHLGKFHRRRAPKIRLLAELLGENGDVKAAIHAQSSPSNATSEASLQADDVQYASKCEVTTEENIWPSNHKRERRFPQNEKCKRQEIPSSSRVDKQVQTWREEVENSLSNSGTENAVWSSCKMDGNNSLRKKKRAGDPDSVSLMPAITQYGNDKEALDSAAVISHPANGLSSKNPHPISLKTMESKCSTSKNPNSSKDLVMVEASADVFSSNDRIIRKDSVMRKDMQISRNVANNTFQYANYKTNESELHLSKGICRREENKLPTFWPPQENNTSRVSKFTRDDSETVYRGGPNPNPYKASDVFYGQGAESMLNGKMANLRMHLSRRNTDPHTDTSWWKLQKEDKYNGSNGKRTIEAQQPLALKKRQINQRADLASDSGTSDDIPMEIVELMAKNQYERRLPDAENNEHVSETGSFSGRAVQVNNYGHIYRNGRGGLLQKPEILKQKAHARNGENAENRAGKVGGETRKRKSTNYFTNIEESQINANHLQQQNWLLRNGIQYSSINRLPVSGHSLEAARAMPNHLPNGCHKFPANSTGSLQMGTAMGNALVHNNFEAYSQKSAGSSFRHRPNGVELHENQIGSLELYSNETISAMHLLSLMDGGMRTNAPTACGMQRSSSKRPPIPRPLSSKEFPGMDIFNSTFQHSRGFATDANSSVVKSRNKEDPPMWSKDQKLQKYVVNASNAKPFMLRTQRNSDGCEFVAHTKTLQNQKRSFESEICSVNKNPADFTLPEAGNKYMIGAEDFNFGRTFHSKNISTSIYFNDGYKRLRHV